MPAVPVKPVNLTENSRARNSSGDVFIIERGNKRLIPDQPTLASLNNTYEGSESTVSDLVLDGYPAGRPVPSVTWPNNHDYVSW